MGRASFEHRKYSDCVKFCPLRAFPAKTMRRTCYLQVLVGISDVLMGFSKVLCRLLD